MLDFTSHALLRDGPSIGIRFVSHQLTCILHACIIDSLIQIKSGDAMKLTRYRLCAQALNQVARSNWRRVRLANVADSYVISNNHFVKVVHQLVNCGYLCSAQGRHGGVSLASQRTKSSLERWCVTSSQISIWSSVSMPRGSVVRFSRVASCPDLTRGQEKTDNHSQHKNE